MSGCEHKTEDCLILDRTDRSPVPDAARIIPAFYPLVKKPQYPYRYPPIGLFQILARAIAQPNDPTHALS
jgi:hypothetical protein